MEWFPPDLVSFHGRHPHHLEVVPSLASSLNFVWFDIAILQWNRGVATCSAFDFSIDCCIVGNADSDMVGST